MIFVFSFIFLLLFWENYAIIKVKDSFKKKDLAFVENLKEDLRRNNDDYADILRNKTTKSSNNIQQSLDPSQIKTDNNDMFNTTPVDKAISITDTPKTSLKLHSLGTNNTSSNFRRNQNKEDERFKIIDNIKKRVDDALLSKESKDNIKEEENPQRRRAVDSGPFLANNTEIIPDINSPSVRAPWRIINKIKQKSTEKVIRNKFKLFSRNNNELTPLPVLTTLPTVTTNIKSKTISQLQHQKKKKIEKFKKFIEKNKSLLREFISSKVAIQTPTVPVPPKTKVRQKKARDSMKVNEMELQQVMRQAVEGLKRKESLERLPRAELLDMAPAKGGRIHKKRLRGRLCHRHVLLPEGPKYSSGGRAYVPPHAGRRAREYNATAEPRLLLPRCCNCCRKSVLGCE